MVQLALCTRRIFLKTLFALKKICHSADIHQADSMQFKDTPMPASLASACSLAPGSLTVDTILRRTRPDSNSYVVKAGGRLYIMKAFPLESAARAARREIFAHAIGTRLGLSMAHWEILHVSGQTLAEYQISSQGIIDTETPLYAGKHYGSLVFDGPGSLTEYLPQAYIEMNSRVARQLACMQMFDLWLAHASRRRCLTVLENDYPMHIYFFSSRNIFSPEIPSAAQTRASFAYAEACRVAGDVKAIHAFVRALVSLSVGEIRAAFEAVPVFWRNASDEESALHFLDMRRRWIKTLAHSGFPMPAQSDSPARQMCDTGNRGRSHTLARPD